MTQSKKVRATMAMLTGLLAFALSLLVTPVTSSYAATASPRQMSYIVIPHPDDEFETWSLVENSSANYKVFIVATRGESSGYCDDAGFYTPEACKAGRLQMFRNYLTQMSYTDPTIPGSFSWTPSVSTYMPSNGVAVSSTRVDVWVDSQGRGAIVAYDLGDGNLTADEVSWAVKTTKNYRTTLGINSYLKNYNLIGAFSNIHNEYGCHIYNHPDHRAVHQAVWNVDFDFSYQAAATCSGDPDADLNKMVTDASWNASFKKPGGAFWNAYGVFVSSHIVPSPGHSQANTFMQYQSFWYRFNG